MHIPIADDPVPDAGNVRSVFGVVSSVVSAVVGDMSPVRDITLSTPD